MKKIMLAILLLSGVAFTAVAQDVVLPERPKTKAYVDYSHKDTGFWITAGANASLMFSDGKSSFFPGIDVVAGYRFGDFLRLGAGVNHKMFSTKTSDANQKNFVDVSIYADVRGNFLPQEHRNFSPYWSFDLGYTMGSNGLYMCPALGLKFGQMRNDFTIALCYILQHQTVSDGAAIENGLGLKIAYEF